MVCFDSFHIESILLTYRVLAIVQGGSRLALGRERHETATGGVEVDIRAGDVVVVPAGVSHRSLTAYGDYRYIGVYPEVRLWFIVIFA